MKSFSVVCKIAALGILILIWSYTLLNYGQLPEVIPTHFDLQGNADGFGPKKMVWLEAVIALVLYIFLVYLSKNTDSPLLNLPPNIKEDRQVAGRVVDILNVLIMALFAVISCESFAVSMGRQVSLSLATLYILAAIFLFIILVLIYSYQRSQKKTSTNAKP